jgi:hypothetical protein
MSTWPRTSSRPSPAKFDPRKFKDEYEKALKKLVRRKAKGHVIEEAPSPERTDNVISGRDRGNLERTPRQELCEPRYFSRCWRARRKTACAHQDQDATL